MKIYFSAPISNVDDCLRNNYEEIISILKNFGHSVLADHLINKKADVIKNQSKDESLAVQKLMSRRKRQADLVLFEVSTPSFGVGQEIAYALHENKQVVALYLEGCKPHLLLDEGADNLVLVEYTLESLKRVLREAIEESQNKMDVRFNFFIPQSMIRYLDWISKHRKLPRAVFLRGLVEKAMAGDKQYQESLS